MTEIGNYLIGKTIGQGTFSKVCQAINQVIGHEAAVKVLEKKCINQEGDVERVKREIQILKVLHHPQIVKLYEVIETENHIYLFMEYANGGELFDYIDRVKQVTEYEACKFLHQIISGLEYMHSLKIIHRDLKPENLLLTSDRDILIADFGLSNLQKDLLKTCCGSTCYAAPEMIQGEPYDGQMTDVWSCGIILFAMICGYLPFDDLNTQNLYQKITNAEFTFPKHISMDAKDLLRRILVVDPQKRYSIQQIKRHKWWQLWKRDNPPMSVFKARCITIPCQFLPNSPYNEEIPNLPKCSPRNAKSPYARSPLTKSPNTKSTTSKISNCTYKQVYDKSKLRQTPSKSLHESTNNNNSKNNNNNNNNNNKQNIFIKQQNQYAFYNKHKKQPSGQYSTLMKQTKFQKVVQSMHENRNQKLLSSATPHKPSTKHFYSHTRKVSDLVRSKFQNTLKIDESQSTKNILQRLTSGLNSLINSPRQPINIRGIEQHNGPYHLSLITKKHPQLFIDMIHNYLKMHYPIIIYENYSISLKLESDQLLEVKLKRIEQIDVYYLDVIQQHYNFSELQKFVQELQLHIKF
ncbi:unnamed protein product (macronuclear) [Paramecium tetraurelia]|uniref:non-specific serine/threonine protein kinase n=1 Tax=Paramecium tetraurelia TaxID=5888 RepID=A0CKQ4_PARTE|nr:uncharacterized protein GSPATT00001085001 [Paramecium tetraurelia]CAK71371.1 unnamed protein product [Paramecium tetraurelia]|eukprot:XP_001438768.1 hypothetical protein (macronuclear) [Paramecium tetraurelia strain d4-2]